MEDLIKSWKSSQDLTSEDSNRLMSHVADLMAQNKWANPRGIVLNVAEALNLSEKHFFRICEESGGWDLLNAEKS